MTDARLGAEAVEALTDGTPSARLGAEAVEALTDGTPSARLGAVAVEALVDHVNDALLGGIAVEALVDHVSLALLGGLEVEALTDYTNYARLAAVAVEVLTDTSSASGPATAQTLEIEFDGASWTDVSSYHEQQAGTTAHFGRADEFSDVTPASFTAVLDNRDGRFTPNNPTSPYWPNVTKDVRVRWTVTGPDGISRVEFLGYADNFAPDFTGGGVDASKVTLDASCRLSRMTRPLLSAYFEDIAYQARHNSATSDIWPLADASDAAAVVNRGTVTSGATGLPGTVVQPTRNPSAVVVEAGTLALGGVDSGIIIDGMVSFNDSVEVCPVIEFPISVGTVAGIQFWARNATFTSTDRVALAGADAVGNRIWELRWHTNVDQMDLNLYDAAAGTFLATLGYGSNDGLWRHYWLQADGATTNGWSMPATTALASYLGYSALALDIRSTAYIVAGGRMTPVTGRGLQIKCGTWDLAGMAVTGYDSFGSGASSVPLLPRGTSDRVEDWSKAIFDDGSAITFTGSMDVDVAAPDAIGNTGIDVLQEIARTVGGVFWTTPAGVVEFRDSDQQRPPSTSLTATVTIEEDDAEPFTLTNPIDTGPTRVTGKGPGGNSLVVSPTEGAIIREETVDTCALNPAQASYAAGYRLTNSQDLRVSSLCVNLATAQNSSLYADLYDLFPGARIRVAALPSAVLGWTYADVFVQGWTKELRVTNDGAGDGFYITMDTTPAIDEAIAGTAKASATSMTATAGTITGTNTGTLVVTTVSGPTLTTDASAYPADFDWNGERVTVTSAPAGSSSPQTITVTARGVAPSVARTHGSAEAFDVWTPARAAF